MLRTSSYLTIAVSIIALGSPTLPAAALPSKVFGGGSNHLSAQLHPVTATTGAQTSREASHALGTVVNLPPKIPTGAGSSGVSPGGKMNPAQKYPAGESTKVVKKAQIPLKDLPDPCAKIAQDLCGKLPPPTPTPTPPAPPPPPAPHPHPGPVVIVVPPVPVQVPVGVPAPYSTPAPVAARTGYGVAASAQRVITPNCITAADNPPLAARIDQLLPTAQLSEADMTRLTALRQSIQELSAVGKAADARDVEEIAMNLLGYQKVWLRCGQGAFYWQPLAGTPAAQAK